jgi:hypothetical protein
VKNKMQDVRNHIVAMMESLADPDVSDSVIQRAKATSELAHAFTNTVRVEIEARRLAGLEETVPPVLDYQAAPVLKAVANG